MVTVPVSIDYVNGHSVEIKEEDKLGPWISLHVLLVDMKSDNHRVSMERKTGRIIVVIITIHGICFTNGPRV